MSVFRTLTETAGSLSNSKPGKKSIIGIFFSEFSVRSAALVLVIFLIAAIFAPLISPYDPLEHHRPEKFMAPCFQYPFGTDEFGRDLLSRVIFGARISLGSAAMAVILSMLVAVPIGLVAGYFGSWVETVSMRGMDVLLAFPAILLAMGIVTILGQNMLTPAFAVTIVCIPAVARIVRAATLGVRNLEFVQAATAMGATDRRILLLTILPNTLAPLFVQAIVNASRAVLLESSLSFLGLGAPPPQASWGSLLSPGRSFVYQAPWYGLFPGVAIMAVLLSLNILADAWQDTSDPVRRRARQLRKVKR